MIEGGNIPLVRLTNCSFTRSTSDAQYPTRRILESISLDIFREDWTLLTGASGSGKTTLAWVIADLLRPTAGQIAHIGQRHPRRGSIQMVFQDPYAALNPRWTLDRWLSDARIENDWRVRSRELAIRLGLPSAVFQCSPLEMSGGECQRACLLSALLHGPDLLILDEAFSMVDDETRTLMLDLMEERHRTRGLSILMIAHDVGEASRRTNRWRAPPRRSACRLAT